MRNSGILLHPTSLPGPHGIGDLGPQAYRFVDFLVESGQSIWQLLPLNPTSFANYNDPYQSTCVFAGNPLLISPEKLMEDGLLEQGDLEGGPDFPPGKVYYRSVIARKQELLAKACDRFAAGASAEFSDFRERNRWWLEDYALFSALHMEFAQAPWARWPAELRDRKERALERAREKHRDFIERVAVHQYLFERQWHALREYCKRKHIRLFGDIAIYVYRDSADTWTHPDLFKLDDAKQPRFVAGVPPDYFSETGQLWGSPVYDWERIRIRKFDWWINRIRRNAELYDILRIDHFRGLIAYWEIAATEKTAVNGKWVRAPGRELLSRLTAEFPILELVAEDLGTITPDVLAVRNDFGLPGMRVLQFAFDGNLRENIHLPHYIEENSYVYTGTHDNNPTRAWFEQETTEHMRKSMNLYTGKKLDGRTVSRDFIRLALTSRARSAIIPLQDWLNEGQQARMNRPGFREGNWEWRLAVIPPAGLSGEIRELTAISGRERVKPPHSG